MNKIVSLKETPRRAEHLLNCVVQPAVYTDHVLLDVAVHHTEDPVPHDQAIKADYRPVELDYRWGPLWSTAWFCLRGMVPESFTGREFRLLFDTGTEALCWWDGTPYQGVELHRQDVKLPQSVQPGQTLKVFIEAACNHMLGVGEKYGCPRRMGLMSQTKEGRLKQAHLAAYHPQRAALACDLEVLIDLARSVDQDSAQGRYVLRGLQQACDLINPQDVDSCIEQIRTAIAKVLNTPTDGTATTAYSVGNAHIDLAWLWPVRETKRKAARTFSTVMRYMERHPDYRFIQSQPQMYEWVRQEYPALFSELQQAAKRGQLETAGAMWVEADCNLISGESMVRQILYGTQYFKEHFDAEQNFLWLPDVFGYSAAMPQILTQCGLDTFFTQKISWNETNKFPHQTFFWEGIDGTAILSHFFPADTYIGKNMPGELRHGEANYKQSAHCPHWLNAYGWGDGGGGPTEVMVERVSRLDDCVGVPHTKHSRVDEFTKVLHQNSDDLPTWVGELYLEMHRGTYTTHAANKRGNRTGERLLQDVELAQSLAGGCSDSERANLLELWRLLLLNQFHDIIPGSGIAWVYEDSKHDYQRIHAEGQKLLADALERCATDNGMSVLNTASHQRSMLVTVPSDSQVCQQTTSNLSGDSVGLAWAADVPALSLAALSTSNEKPDAALSIDGLTLQNEHLIVKLDEVGRVVSLIDRHTQREAALPDQPANQLVLYDDQPPNWDAWDITSDYLRRPDHVNQPAEWRVVEDGPLRVACEFTRKLGQQSRLVQRVQLTANARMVEFATRVDWHEKHRMLRVLHPVAVHSDFARYEIQFGHVRRPNHFNTSWDTARFEVCAQRWMDLSEPGFGVALLNDCKYGHSANGQVMGMSLLRSTDSPDPEADMGVHEFTYALMPHGEFDGGEVTAAAELLNHPPRVVPGVSSPGTQSLLTINGEHAGRVIVDGCKPAEDSRGVIVRLYEAAGGTGTVDLQLGNGWRMTEEVDLLERAKENGSSATQTDVRFTPFKIRSFRLER